MYVYMASFNTIVGFLQKTSVHAVHTIAASATFALGIIYYLLQTVMTKLMSPQHSSPLVFKLRTAISVFAVVSAAFGKVIRFEYSGFPCFELLRSWPPTLALKGSYELSSYGTDGWNS